MRHRVARFLACLAAVVAGGLFALGCADAVAQARPIDAYHDFLHWVSVDRFDLALEQFTDDAVVVAGARCACHDPCIGKAALRQRYFPALRSADVPLPLADLRFDGSILRTRGDAQAVAVSGAALSRQQGTHHIVLRGPLIAGLYFQPSASEAGTRLVTLVHRFAIPANREWKTITIDLTSNAWRVGGVNGPAATRGQMRAVVDGLVSLQIGGRCSVRRDGSTTYPCSLALRDIQFAGAASDGVTLVASEIQTATTRAASALPRVAWYAPAAFLGRAAWEDGDGTLTFAIRGAPNPLAPSPIDRASGLVIVQGRTPIRRSQADDPRRR